MSDHIVQTYHDNDAKASESVHPYQSAWIAHWIRKSYNSSSWVHGHLDPHDGSNVEDCDTQQEQMLVQVDDPKMATSLDKGLVPVNIEYGNACRCQQGCIHLVSDVPNSTKADRVEIGGVEISNEILAMNLTDSRNANSEWQPFPMSGFNQKIDGVFSPKKEPSVYNTHASGSQTDENSSHVTTTVGTRGPNFSSTLLKLVPNEIEFPLKHYRFQSERIHQSPVKWPNLFRPFERKSLPLPGHSQDDRTGSSSNVLLHGFKSGRKPVQSFMYRNDETDQSRMVVSSKEDFINTKFTCLEYEHCNYHGYTTFLVCDKKVDCQIVARNSESSYLGQKDSALKLLDPSVGNFYFPMLGKRSCKMCRFSGPGFSPSYSCPPGGTGLDDLSHGYYFQRNMPTCSAHAVEALKICTTVDSVENLPPSHQNLSQKSHNLLIINKIDDNSSKENQMIRQSSSADTDIMDADVFQERNSFPGSCSSNKDFMVDQNPAQSQATVASPSGKNGTGKTEMGLPDINQGPPAFVVAESSMDNRDLSTSRTESLDLEHFLSHSEHPEYSNSSAQKDVLLGLPSSRWVKRLKLSASDFLARGTKSSKTEDASSSGKVTKLFKKNMNYSGSSSESALSRHHGKGQMKRDKSMALVKYRESFNMDSVKEHQDPTLSNPWIQRFCHNRAVVRRLKSAAPVVCGPQSSKSAFNKFQRKQFPSIAAMALMGKAANCFQPCEFRKRGSVIVWNTDGF